ncbi:MAG: DedA family protein [Panacagrimonas sp.]
MLHTAQELLSWIGAHPTGALVLLFFVAMVDALFLVGAFVPAAVVLFGMGALVALDTLQLWPTVLVAAAGALAGDGLSFALGRRYGERLFDSPSLARYPELIARGRAFFARHGGKGVMLARFLGPVRSITPALAGASQMSVWLFLAVDSVAAVCWALVYLVPGVVFGASLGLAAEVAARLAGLMVLSIGLIVLAIWAVRAGIALFNRNAEHRMEQLLAWSRRHRHLGRFGPGLADPHQPEMPALIAVALMLLVAGAAWLVAFGGVGWRDYPGPLDALVHQTLADLSTPWGLALAQAVTRLGEWPVYGTVATAVLATLIWRRRLRAAAYWIAALIFGVAVTLALHFAPLLPPPNVFFGAVPAHASTPRDLLLCTVIYGTAATLFATLRPVRVRSIAYGLATALLLLLALARLVLAQDWLSYNGFALVLGALWAGALSLGYRGHRPERMFAGSFILPVGASFVIATGMSWGLDRAMPPVEAPVALREMSIEQWWDGGWQTLPLARQDVRGRSLRPFDLQWAAPIRTVESELRGARWDPLPPFSAYDAMRWLTETTPIYELPVLPQVHAGNHARLTLRQGFDSERQGLLRLWDSQLRVRTEDGLVPVWLGTVTEQHARTYYKLFRYPVSEPEGPMLPPLPERTTATTLRVVEPEGHRMWLMGPPRKGSSQPAMSGLQSEKSAEHPGNRQRETGNCCIALPLPPS